MNYEGSTVRGIFGKARSEEELVENTILHINDNILKTLYLDHLSNEQRYILNKEVYILGPIIDHLLDGAIIYSRDINGKNDAIIDLAYEFGQHFSPEDGWAFFLRHKRIKEQLEILFPDLKGVDPSFLKDIKNRLKHGLSERNPPLKLPSIKKVSPGNITDELALRRNVL